MKTFFKFLTLLVLIIVTISVAWYTINKDAIHKTVHLRLEKELSSILHYPVTITSIEHISFNSISMGNILFQTPSLNETIAEAQKLTISIDSLTLIKNRQLVANVKLDNMRIKDTLSNIQIKILSEKDASYLKVFDISLIKSILIIDGKLKTKNIIFRDITGNIELDKMTITKSHMEIALNDRKFLLNLNLNSYKTMTYALSLVSQDVDLSLLITKDSDFLLIDSLTGTLFAATLDIKGALTNYLSNELKYKLNGVVTVDLEKLENLPINITKKISCFGVIRSNVFLESTGLTPLNATGSITLSGNNLKINKVKIKEINSKIYLDRSRINAPLINGILYDGDFTSNLSIDLSGKNVPYLFSLVINNLNFGSLLEDLTSSSIRVYGTFQSELSLKGLMKLPETFQGEGEFSISGANLGPMPILTPLLGDIFSVVSNIIPGANMVAITEAHANINIENEKITTNNLLLQGEDLSISGSGFVGFDGKLDLEFQNEFKTPPSESEESWQSTIRNSISNFGKAMSRARLKGTLGKPKWEMEYFDSIKRNLNKNIKNFLGIVR